MIFSLWTAGTLRADEQTPSQIRGFTPSTFPPLGCSGQSSLPEDSVEVELDLMAQKGSMDGNVSRPANQGVQPRRFYRSRNGWLWRVSPVAPRPSDGPFTIRLQTFTIVRCKLAVW